MKRKYDETTNNTQMGTNNIDAILINRHKTETKYFLKQRQCDMGQLSAQAKVESIKRRKGTSIKLGDNLEAEQLKALPQTYKLITFTEAFLHGAGSDLDTLKTLMHALPATVLWVELDRTNYSNHSHKEILDCFPNWITVFSGVGKVFKLREKNENYDQFVENQLKQEKQKELSQNGFRPSVNPTPLPNHLYQPRWGNNSAPSGIMQTQAMVNHQTNIPVNKRIKTEEGSGPAVLPAQSLFPSRQINLQQVLQPKNNALFVHAPAPQVPDHSAPSAKAMQAPVPMQISPLYNGPSTQSLKNNRMEGHSPWQRPALGQGFLQNAGKSQDLNTLPEIGPSSQKLIFQQSQQYSGRALPIEGAINYRLSQAPAFPKQPIHETPSQPPVMTKQQNQTPTKKFNQVNSFLGKSQSEVPHLKDVESNSQIEEHALTFQIQLIVAKDKLKYFKNKTRQAKAEAQQAEAEAQQAKAEAQQAKAEAQQAKAEAQQAKAEAQQAKAEAQQAKAKAQQAKAKAQQAKAKAQFRKNEDMMAVDILMSLDKTDQVNDETQMTNHHPVNSTRPASRASTNSQAFFSFNEEVLDSVVDELHNKGPGNPY